MKPTVVIHLSQAETVDVILQTTKQIAGGGITAAQKEGTTGLEDLVVTLKPNITMINNTIIDKAKEQIPKGFEPRTSAIAYQLVGGVITGSSVTFCN